jgi:hypothetical protein
MPRNGERLEISREAYHEHPGISNSKLSDYLESPKLYWARHIAKTMGPKKESPPMRKGTLGHLCALEGKRWQKDVVIEKKFDRRKVAEREQCTKWEESLGPNSVVVTEAEKEFTERMVAEIKNHPEARTWLFDMPGASEVAVRWDDEEHDLVCKALWDREVQGGLVDLKFLANPKKDFWSKWGARDRGYHRQAAHYIDAYSAVTGLPRDEVRFIFVCVQNQEPFDIFCYELEWEFLLAAWEELRSIKKRLKISLASNNWHPPGSTVLNKVPWPMWAYDEKIEAMLETQEDEG